MQVRSLTPDDLPKRGRPKGAVAEIRVKHHRMAKAVAAGLSDAQAASLIGCTAPTIRNFRNNPAFANLVAEYGTIMDSEFDDELAHRVTLGRRAATLSSEKIVDLLEADAIDNPKVLLAIAADFNDRTGVGKVQTQVNLIGNLGERMSKARARVRELNEKKILEGVIQGDVVKLRRF